MNEIRVLQHKLEEELTVKQGEREKEAGNLLRVSKNVAVAKGEVQKNKGRL